jgi:hypothetical protein
MLRRTISSRALMTTIGVPQYLPTHRATFALACWSTGAFTFTVRNAASGSACTVDSALHTVQCRRATTAVTVNTAPDSSGDVDAACVWEKRRTCNDDGTAARLIPEDLCAMIVSLRNGRPLNDVLRARRASFFASNPDFRTVRPALNHEDGATSPYVYEGGHDLMAKIGALPMWRIRSPLMAVGARGSGKTVLLLRALDVLPRAQPKLDLARVYHVRLHHLHAAPAWRT